MHVCVDIGVICKCRGNRWQENDGCVSVPVCVWTTQ